MIVVSVVDWVVLAFLDVGGERWTVVVVRIRVVGLDVLGQEGRQRLRLLVRRLGEKPRPTSLQTSVHVL